MLKRRRFNAQTPPLPKISQNRPVGPIAARTQTITATCCEPLPAQNPARDSPAGAGAATKVQAALKPYLVDWRSVACQVPDGKANHSPAPTPVLIPAGDITIFLSQTLPSPCRRCHCHCVQVHNSASRGERTSGHYVSAVKRFPRRPEIVQMLADQPVLPPVDMDTAHAAVFSNSSAYKPS